MSTAAIIGGTVAAGLGGAAIASSGAQNAASTQAQASTQAAQLQYQAEQQALQQQQLMYGNALQLLGPGYMQGQGALANLSNLLGLPVQGNLVNPAQLPTGLGGNTGVAQPTPYAGGGSPLGGPSGGGYRGFGGAGNPYNQYRPAMLGNTVSGGPVMAGGATVGGGAPPVQGTGMLPGGQRIAAGGGPTSLQSLINPSLGATGSLMQPWTQQFQAPTGLTEQNDPGYQARLQLGQTALQNSAAARGGLLTGGTAAGLNQYAQDYASNEYSNVYNRAFNQYATSYNQFQQNQANQYNRLASLAGLGQTTAGQLATIGGNAGQGIANTLLTGAGQIGGALQNAGAARASGYVGSANAYGGALSGLGSLGTLLALSGQLGGGGGTFDPGQLYDPGSTYNPVPGGISG